MTNVSSAQRKFDFPFRLHSLLEYVETTGQENIIRWHKSGEAFRIFELKAFENQIMPSFYVGTKYKSFLRQLNIYGFRRIKDPRSQFHGCYYHPFFVKGKPYLCRFMKRIKVTGNRWSRNHPPTSSSSPFLTNNRGELNGFLPVTEHDDENTTQSLPPHSSNIASTFAAQSLLSPYCPLDYDEMFSSTSTAASVPQTESDYRVFNSLFKFVFGKNHGYDLDTPVSFVLTN